MILKRPSRDKTNGAEKKTIDLPFWKENQFGEKPVSFYETHFWTFAGELLKVNLTKMPHEILAWNIGQMTGLPRGLFSLKFLHEKIRRRLPTQINTPNEIAQNSVWKCKVVG